MNDESSDESVKKRFGVELRNTGKNQERINAEKKAKQDIYNNQKKLEIMMRENKNKKDIFETRQGSLAVDAMMGNQDLLHP